MAELKKVRRVLTRLDPTAPHEVLLVLDGSQGQNALAQAQQFQQAVGVTGLVMTKLDGTAKGGIVLAIADTLKLPIRYIGIGETAADFDVFDAGAFVDAVLSPVRARVPARDPFRSRFQALPERARGGQRPLARNRARRDGVSHRPFGRGQEHAAQADRADRAAEQGHAGRQRPEHVRPAALEDPCVPPPDRRRVPGPQAADGPAGLRQRRPAARHRRRAREGNPEARACRARPGGPAGPRTFAPDRTLDRRAAARRHRARDHRQAGPADRRRTHRQPRPGSRDRGHEHLQALQRSRRDGADREPRHPPDRALRRAARDPGAGPHGRLVGRPARTALPEIRAD